MSSLLKQSKPDPHAPLRFVSIGECMVELAPSGQGNDYTLGFAGDTFNTAWYLKALAPNWSSRFVSRVGKDDVSDKMLDMMMRAGIETDHIGRDASRSVGLYLISLRDGERSFSYWRDQSAARLLARDDLALRAATQDGDVLYFSGITMAILDDAGRDRLLDVIAGARVACKTIVFDSNLRPRLWASTDVMTRTVMRAAAHSDIVLPSFDDEAVHFGDADMDATRLRYLNAGAGTVIIKNGAGSVHFVHDGETGQVAAQPATAVVDTTSAGDSFNAGFLVGLHTTGSATKAIATASAVAAHVIGQKGALVELPATMGAAV